MALATEQAQTINGKTRDLKTDIRDANRAFIKARAACPTSPHVASMTDAYNGLRESTEELIEFQGLQIQMLEASAAWIETKLADAGINLKAILRGEQ